MVFITAPSGRWSPRAERDELLGHVVGVLARPGAGSRHGPRPCPRGSRRRRAPSRPSPSWNSLSPRRGAPSRRRRRGARGSLVRVVVRQPLDLGVGQAAAQAPHVLEAGRVRAVVAPEFRSVARPGRRALRCEVREVRRGADPRHAVARRADLLRHGGRGDCGIGQLAGRVGIGAPPPRPARARASGREIVHPGLLRRLPRGTGTRSCCPARCGRSRRSWRRRH